ncbi:MAG: hypothetical protein AW07_02131 [Candidatus Accumulibacter sp. SK-11]|nr:MAG: hypothetical protein AW07_02131 [Candidatus Accumulibacter sp. SK-11]
MRLQDGAVELFGLADLARLMALAGLRQRLCQSFFQRGGRRSGGSGRGCAQVSRRAAHLRLSPSARRRKPR